MKENKENLALSLFGDPPTIKVVLDEDAPKEKQVKDEAMDGGDTNCACE